jgi:DNA replication protein DnaC
MTIQKSEDLLMARAKALQLHGVIAHWDETAESDWIEPLIQWAEDERVRRGLERRLKSARLGRFKPLADFDWSWPSQCDHEAVNDLMQLNFLRDATNVILVGPNGVGKSTIARNIAHQAVLRGHNVLFTSASQMLNELAAQDGDSALKRRLALYARPQLLLIDEVGYLSYSNRHADLLFEIVSRRYEEKSTLVTTNRPFAEWSEVFPNAACVVSLVDRLVHHSEIIAIAGESYRLKEAKEHQQRQAASRKKRKTTPRKKGCAS